MISDTEFQGYIDLQDKEKKYYFLCDLLVN